MNARRVVPALFVALAALAPLRSEAAPATSPTVRQAHPASLPRTATWPTAKPEVLGFIADDYAKAVTEARARRVPIFVESWAPW